MADSIVEPDEATAKLARRKAQKKAATDRFFAKQKAAGRRYHAEDYARNREKRRAQRKARHRANRETENRKAAEKRLADPVGNAQIQARFRAKHKGRLAANARIRRSANRQHVLEIERRSRFKHREKRRVYRNAYRLANLLLFRAAQSRIRAIRRGVLGRYSPADVARLFAAQRGLCAYCRKSIRHFYHVDHIIPISKGGTNWPRNLQLLCVPCNLHKHAKDPLDFAREMGRLL